VGVLTLPERLIVLSVEWAKTPTISGRTLYGKTCRAVRIRFAQGQLREESVSPGAEMLRCAQNDKTGIDRESS
jgi:hypothetical protein